MPIVSHGLSAVAIAVFWCALPMPALALDDDVVEALRAEIEFLRARVEKLEAQIAPGDAGVSPTLPASVQTPAMTQAAPIELVTSARSSIEVGGRVKVDTIVNSVSAGRQSSNRADLAFIPGAIPVVGNGADGQIKFSARNSRLWFKAISPSPLGDVDAYIEIDYFSADAAGNESITNGYTPRLRHGYGEWREWLGGQTYSTLIDLSAYPEINDDGAPLGVLLVRQVMVRWTREGRNNDVMLALESPESIIRNASGGRLTPDDDRWPDLVARYTQRHAWGHWSLGGILREIRIDQDGFDDTAIGGGLSASGLVRVGERDDVRFTVSGGNALGRYLSAAFFDDARLKVSGDLDLSFSGGGYLAYRHWWTRQWRSNVVLGGAWMEPDGAFDSENEWGYSLHANLIWSPMLTTSLGVEWIHGERQLVSGRDGSLDRLQFTAIHKF